jgi:hypothetical protein
MSAPDGFGGLSASAGCGDRLRLAVPRGPGASFYLYGKFELDMGKQLDLGP